MGTSLDEVFEHIMSGIVIQLGKDLESHYKEIEKEGFDDDGDYLTGFDIAIKALRTAFLECERHYCGYNDRMKKVFISTIMLDDHLDTVDPFEEIREFFRLMHEDKHLKKVVYFDEQAKKTCLYGEKQ